VIGPNVWLSELAGPGEFLIWTGGGQLYAALQFACGARVLYRLTPLTAWQIAKADNLTIISLGLADDYEAVAAE
jgi:hypothetical protein